MEDHQFKEENESVGELSAVCSHKHTKSLLKPERPRNRITGVIVQTLVHCSAGVSRSRHETSGQIANTVDCEGAQGYRYRHWISQDEKIREQKFRNNQRSVSIHAQQSSQQPWVTGLWVGLAEFFEEHSTTSITDTEQSKSIHLFSKWNKSILVWTRWRCDSAHIDQYDEVKNCKANTHNTLRNFGAPSVEQVCKYSQLHTNAFFSRPRPPNTTTNYEHDHHTTIRLQPTRKGWRFVVTSPWMWLHTRGSWWVPARTPTVHGGFYGGRPWVARTTTTRTTRLQTTAEQEQALSRFSLRSKNSSHCYLEIIRNMLVLSMSTNLTEKDWKVCSTGITKITSLQKEYIHWSISIWYTGLFRCLKHSKSTRCEGSSGKKGKLEKNTVMAVDESQK